MARQKKITHIEPQELLESYKAGIAAWGDGSERGVEWISCPSHYLLDIETMRVPKSLKREILNRRPYEVTINTAFADVVDSCAVAKDPEVSGYWLNKTIRKAFNQLHKAGHAHSVECWAGDELAGGLYGLAIGSTFFSESMFYFNDGEGKQYKNAGKTALVHLTATLWASGFKYHDSQAWSPFLSEYFGLYEIPRDFIKDEFNAAMATPARFGTPVGVDQQQVIRAYFEHRGNLPPERFKERHPRAVYYLPGIDLG